MSETSSIEWTDATWSPVTGCTKVSPGCKHCYAEREVEQRWSKNSRSKFYGRRFTDIRVHPEALAQPAAWSRGRRIFVCPRADLFHGEVPFDFIAEVFAAMAATPRHTYQVLTKRASRMLEFFGWLASEPVRLARMGAMWPLPNVWLGTSIEDNERARERIGDLLRCPAALRFVSAEPLIERLDLTLHVVAAIKDRPSINLLHWVIVGGESGKDARPMHPEWVDQIRRECADNGWAFFFKQWGEWKEVEARDEDGELATLEVDADSPEARKLFNPDTDLLLTIDGRRFTPETLPDDTPGRLMRYVGKRITGQLLDGRYYFNFPEVPRAPH